MNKVHTGPIHEGVAALQTAIPLMEDRRDFVGGAFARGWLAIGYAELGDFERAEAAAEDAKRKAETGGDLIAQLDAQIADAMVHSIKGDLDGAVPIARACIDRAGETGATACGMVSAWVLGDAQQRGGRLGEAEEAFQLGHRPRVGHGRAVLGTDAPDVAQGELRRCSASWRQRTMAGTRRWRGCVPAATTSARPGSCGSAPRREPRRSAGMEAFADFEAASVLSEAQGARPQLARVLRTWGDALRAVRTPRGR